MGTKLDWRYDIPSEEYRADYRGLRIRAVRDEDPCNPFENEDGYWPMLVWGGDCATGYGQNEGVPVFAPLDRFTDGQIVHDQKAIDEILKVGPFYDWETDKEVKWVRDPVWLRVEFANALTYEPRGRLFGLYTKLYDLLGIPYLHTTSTGYSQRDWAELLIVATPEAQRKFYGAGYFAELEPITGLGQFRVGHQDLVTGWHDTLEAAHAEYKTLLDAKIIADMENQAKLYGAWAWGDVYGYVIERILPVVCLRCDKPFDTVTEECPACGDELARDEPEELDSRWGFYGSDWSGLEEAAIDAADSILRGMARIAEGSLAA